MPSGAAVRKGRGLPLGRGAVAAALPTLGALCLTGCPHAHESAPDGGATPPDSPAAAAPSAHHDRPQEPRHPKSEAKCRAPTVEGGVGMMPLAFGDLVVPAVRDASAPPIVVDAGIVAMGEIPNDAWLDVAPGGRLVAKDPVSTRETTFVGPLRGRACVDSTEESWVLRGVFESVPGAGERPGGEEWLVTPHAVVRYASAGMRVVVSRTVTEINVSKGAAYVWLPARSSQRVTLDGGAVEAGDDAGWSRLQGGMQSMIRPTKSQTDDDAARAAVEDCAVAAKAAHDLADSIAQSTAEAGAAFGDLAAKHVSARRLARASCRVALLRVEAMHPSAARDTYLTGTRAADESWRAVASPADAAHASPAPPRP